MASGPVAGSPLLKKLTLVLTNGASLRLMNVNSRTKPIFATYDVYNHSKWDHKLETDASLEADKNFLPDLSSFYNKFSSKHQRGAAGSADKASR